MSRAKGGLARCTALAAVAAAALLAGCQPAATPAPATPPLAEACPERLHDLAGELLLYYGQHGELPARLEGPDGAPPRCPVCGEPYVYDRAGVAVTNWPGRMIVYDAKPCHNGARWGILIEAPDLSQPLKARVVRPAERTMQWRLPGPSRILGPP